MEYVILLKDNELDFFGKWFNDNNKHNYEYYLIVGIGWIINVVEFDLHLMVKCKEEKKRINLHFLFVAPKIYAANLVSKFWNNCEKISILKLFS